MQSVYIAARALRLRASHGMPGPVRGRCVASNLRRTQNAMQGTQADVACGVSRTRGSETSS
eukprot:591455-Rhodomonas_salina.1